MADLLLYKAPQRTCSADPYSGTASFPYGVYHSFGSGVVCMVKRIGLFGGSFNPIHIGHLVIAEAAWQEFGLEKLIFIPSGDTPNKDMHHIDKFDRYNMVKEAVKDNPHFALSPIERDRCGPSYTGDTVHSLIEEWGPY